MEKIQQSNIEAYRTDAALAKYSSYYLEPVEKYLISKYFSKSDKVLDLGCGSGRTTLILYEMGYPCKGLDISDVLIDLAKNRFPYIEFQHGDYCDIRERNESYCQVLLSHNGLDYAYPVNRRLKAITEVARVLKPGGIFIFSSHNINSLHFSPYYFRNFTRIRWKFMNSFIAFKEYSYINDLNMHTFFSTNKHIVDQVESNGLELLEICGFRMSKNKFFNNYISPYNHFVFKKA